MTLPETQDLTLIGALVVAIGFLVRMLFKYIDTQLKDELKQIDTIEQTIVVKDTFYTPAINVQDSFAYQVGDTTQRTDSATGVIVTTIIQPEYIKQFVYVPPDTLIQQDTILIRTPVERIVTKPHKKTDLDHVKNIVFWMIVIYLLIRIILKITRVNFPF
jgi:hypothetical protein